MSGSISMHDAPAVEILRRELRLDPERIRRLRNALLKRFEGDAAALDDFPAPARLALHALREDHRRDSAVDGATKLLLRTAADLVIETVVMRIASGRTTVCVSCQVGCAAACRFCATGQMGMARPLSVDEILDQVVRAGQLLRAEGRRLGNIVFMGMGEPFHNEENVHHAIEALASPHLFAHPPTKILVSTVGIADAMVRFAERFPRVKLAVSLHSVRQDVREKLMPLAKRYPLPILRSAMAEVNRVQRSRVMVEYLMLDGLNDADEDARHLAGWLSGLDVHVNLIPFNAIAGAEDLRGSAPGRREAFGALLKEKGLRTTMRYSLGQGIEAACGQLVRRRRATENANAAHPGG